MAKIFKNSNPILTSGYGNREWYDVNGILQRDFHIGLDAVANTPDRFDYLIFPYDCSISRVDKGVLGYQGGGSYGNNVVFYLGKIDGHTYEMRYAHLKYGSIPNYIYSGANVMANEVAGYMGATGNVNGAHVHIEVIIDGKTVDPYNYIFGNALDDLFKKISIPTPVARDTTVNQIEVIVDDLNVRTGAGTNYESKGFCKKGYYSYLDNVFVENMQWYKIDNDRWVALFNDSLRWLANDNYVELTKEPIIEQPIVTEPTIPTENNDIKPVEEDNQEDNTNTTEIEKVPKSGFKLIIYTIIKNILDYLKERYNNDKKNFKGN